MTNAVESLPAAELRKVLLSADDDALVRFMHGYSLGVGSDLFISVMTEPNQRVEFFMAIAKTYPDDWKKAVESLRVEELTSKK
jgi:hypothetical protein